MELRQLKYFLKAKELLNFTGIGSSYEAPENPDVRLDTAASSVEAAVERLIGVLEARGLTGGVAC